MKLWYFAAMLLVLGVAYFAISSSSRASTVAIAKGNNSALTNQLFAGLGSAIGAFAGKIAAPSARSSNGVSGANDIPSNFNTSDYSTENGFMFTDSDGTFIAG